MIEEALGTKLVWNACRHHVLEIILSDVFSCNFVTSTSPETILYKRFQKKWSSINQCNYSTPKDQLFQDPVLTALQHEMLDYLL